MQELMYMVQTKKVETVKTIIYLQLNYNIALKPRSELRKVID